MTTNYRPKLRTIRVPLDDLLLDPNNPRFLTHSEDRVPDDQIASHGEQIRTQNRMAPHAAAQGADEFHIEELIESILTNGWNPVDMIFVKALPGTDHYLVLEGNRRVTALRKIKESSASEEGEQWNRLKGSVDPLEVKEILDEDSIENLNAKVTYLLGVRHHGSLKQWSPFAQSHNIYERYLRYSGQVDETFSLDNTVVQKIADTLSIRPTTVEERLRVYRVMKQIDAMPNVREIGIQGRYYSICREVLQRGLRSNSPFKGYIEQDPNTLLLSDDSLVRMDALCHFSQPNRNGAPMRNPREWRAFENILKDPDAAERGRMVERVEVGKEFPTDVYAERAAELRTPRWDKWLQEVTQLLRTIQLGDLEVNDESTEVARQLDRLLDQLEERTD